MVAAGLQSIYCTTIRVVNGIQATAYYTTRYGFTMIGRRRAEQAINYVLRQGDVTIVIEASLNPNSEIARAAAEHGDHISDIAFEVDDLQEVFQRAIKRGAKSVLQPWSEKDEFGCCELATISGFKNMTHTLIQRSQYHGVFLPHLKITCPDPIEALLPPIVWSEFDHIASNQAKGTLEATYNSYKDMLNLSTFWTSDDLTKSSSVTTNTLANDNQSIRLLFAEPRPHDDSKKSQNQEFLDYNGGPGIHHIALGTSDIINTIRNLKTRGVEFLTAPTTYYTDLKRRLAQSPLKIQENLDTLEELSILLDFDDRGYLLQIFAKPLTDRPTTFIEVIQRHEHNGFGAGNFKALFQLIEDEQAKRGNLYV